MKTSYLTAGMRPGQLFRLIGRNRISARPGCISRICFLAQSSIWSAFFSLVEKSTYARILKEVPVPPDPIFIIGHWRTGSTFLHQLMNLDPNLAAPTLFQVAVPDSFLVSHRYYRPIFSTMVEKHRPMDMVKLGMDEPQEDEYAIFRITDCSPLERIVFPKSTGYFLLRNDDFMPPPEKIDQWSAAVTGFYRKLSFKTRKIIVSKNPFNSLRIPLLIKLFPNARFIHIGRNPLDVVPSTVNMWNIVAKQNALNDNFAKPGIHDVVEAMENMHKIIQKDLASLKSNRHTIVRFEDLEANPAEIMHQLYASIGLTFSPALSTAIEGFRNENLSFQKNTFLVSEADRKLIISESTAYREYFGYL